MFILLAALVVFFFLVLGAVAFVACVSIPLARKYALSTALWFAVWGPCAIAWMMLAGLGIAAGALTMRYENLPLIEMPKLLAAFGWSYVLGGVCLTAVLATGLALIHQKLIHRCTFLLFRLYVSVVSAGVGSVFGWCLCWWLLAKPAAPFGLWVCPFAMLLLVAGFGMEAYKNPRALRGDAPTRFTWITPEEFAGPAKN